MASGKFLSLPVDKSFTIKRWLSFFTIFSLIAFIQLPYAYLIINFGDCGYFAANHDLANHLGLQHIKVVPWWWFSDIVGGWWLKLIENQGLWGAKLGAAIVLALTGTVTANTFFQIYKPDFRIVCAVIFAGFCLPCEIINYVTVPTLMYAIFCLCFLKLNLDPSRNDYPVFCGISFAFLVFSRMPLIFALFIPLLSLLICRRIEKDRFVFFASAYLKMLGVMVFCFFAFILWLKSENLLEGYFLYQSPSKLHNRYYLVSLLWSQVVNKGPFLVFALLFSFGLYFVIAKEWLSRRALLFYSIIFLMLNVLTALLYVKYPALKGYLRLIWPDEFELYILLVSINIVCIYLIRKSITFPEIVLSLLGIAWPPLRMLGSALGFAGITTGFLLCGFTFLLIYRVAIKYDFKIPLFCLAAIISLMMGGKTIKGISHYSRPPLEKITYRQLPRLDGVYAPPELTRNLSELIHEMGRYVKPGNRILAFPYIPLVYYASGTLPLGDHSCHDFLDLDAFKIKLDQIAGMMPPVLIVRSKMDFDQAREAVHALDPEGKCAIFDEKIIKRWEAKLIWANEYFELFLPRKSSENTQAGIRS